jgi:hypothetical protein
MVLRHIVMWECGYVCISRIRTTQSTYVLNITVGLLDCIEHACKLSPEIRWNVCTAMDHVLHRRHVNHHLVDVLALGASQCLNTTHTTHTTQKTRTVGTRIRTQQHACDNKHDTILDNTHTHTPAKHAQKENPYTDT